MILQAPVCLVCVKIYQANQLNQRRLFRDWMDTSQKWCNNDPVCSSCQNTHRDPIPWTELFRESKMVPGCRVQLTKKLLWTRLQVQEAR